MANEPKKGIKLSLLVRPQAEVRVGANTIYLYSPRLSDLNAFSSKYTNVDATIRFRELLPHIASLSVHTDFEKEREPLSLELVEQLSDEELERIADAYVAIPDFNEVRTGGKDVVGITRQDGESAVTFLNRLLTAEAEHHRRIFEKIYLDSTASARKLMEQINISGSSAASKLLEQLKLSSSGLGDRLKEYEKLSMPSAIPMEAFNTSTQELFRAENERHARLARERKEELEMTRLTGEMTAQSARLLQDLAQASSDFLLRFDQRSEKADKDTRWQLKIAVGSVVMSAILAMFALGIAIASYQQDDKNNLANDQWQKEEIELQKAKLEKRIQTELEVEQLKSQLIQFEKQNKHLPKIDDKKELKGSASK